MRRIVFAITMLAVTAGFTATASVAQNPLPSPPAGQPQHAVPPQTLELATAQKMVAAAEAAATAMNKQITICVMDTNGDVVLAERMDGLSHNAVISAEGKARAVLMFGTSTASIAQAIREKKPISAPVRSLPMGYGGEYTLSAGGLPVTRGGKMIGAIGVGGTPVDDKFAQAGIDAISTK